MTLNNLPTVSIIIPTYNEEKNISMCLKSIKHQTYSKNKIEIIVVDNNSFDHTVEIARKFTDKVFSKGPERSAQRNFAVQKTEGKYVLYLDADMILSENVIRECVTKCEGQGCIALYIPEHIVDFLPEGKAANRNMASRFWIKVRDFERSFYNTTCVDAVRFVRKSEVLKVGGFDESFFAGEDWDFDRRVRKFGRVDIISSTLYHNEEGFSLKKYMRKKGCYFKDLTNYIEKWGKYDPIVKKQLGFRYRAFSVFVEDGKWKKLLRHPLLTIDMYLLKFMIFVQINVTKLRSEDEYRFPDGSYFPGH